MAGNATGSGCRKSAVFNIVLAVGSNNAFGILFGCMRVLWNRLIDTGSFFNGFYKSCKSLVMWPSYVIAYFWRKSGCSYYLLLLDPVWRGHLVSLQFTV